MREKILNMLEKNSRIDIKDMAGDTRAGGSQ